MTIRLLATLISIHFGLAVAAQDTSPPPKSFKLCAACHTTAVEGQYRHAPPLDGIIGRDIASVPGFPYSERLLNESGVWTREKLDKFLADPKHTHAGTGMYFRGIHNPKARSILITWLANNRVPSVIPSHSDRQESPSVTPEEKAAQFFRPCGACHSFSEGEPAKIGPNLWGVVGRPVASFPGFDYSERLLRRGGVWTEDRLIEFFEEEKHFEQGTHAAFRNMQTREDRELLLSLLKSLNSAP